MSRRVSGRSRAVAVAVVLAGCGGAPRQAAEPPPPSLEGAEGAVPGDGRGAPPGELARGTAALERGDLASAKAAFEGMLKKNDHPAEATYYLGVVAEKGGDPAGAERQYRRALELAPDLDAAALNLSALLVDAGRFDDAIAVARALLGRRPDATAVRLNLAMALAGKGDGGAAREFQDVVRRAPRDAMARLTYGHYLVEQKEHDAAVVQLIAAREAGRSDVGMVAAAGHELRLAGAFGECVATFGQALALKDAAELRTERALCRLGAKDEAGATDDLRAAVAAEPRYAPAQFYWGGRLAAAGKWKEAAAAYEAYLKLEPDGPLVAAAKERLAAAKRKVGKR